MNNSITDLLKTFTGKELKDFREFLKSPYFNKRSAVLKLFDVIVKFHPEYESPLLTKEKVFNIIIKFNQ